jgi:hypothetical protein
MTRLRILLATVLLAATGCGQGPAATVSGTVTLDGQPLPTGSAIDGTVMFYPQTGGAAAYGSVKEGRYEVRTGGAAGLAPGKYDVTVRIVEIGPPPVEGAPPAQNVLSPERYGSRSSSGLVCDVQSGDNAFDIDLTRP